MIYNKVLKSPELSEIQGTAGLGVCCTGWSFIVNKMGAHGIREMKEGGINCQPKSLY